MDRAIVPATAAIAPLVLPGVAISWCLRLRDFSGIALVPVLSKAAVGVAGILHGCAGMAWDPGIYLWWAGAGCVLAVLMGIAI